MCRMTQLLFFGHDNFIRHNVAYFLCNNFPAIPSVFPYSNLPAKLISLAFSINSPPSIPATSQKHYLLLLRARTLQCILRDFYFARTGSTQDAVEGALCHSPLTTMDGG